MNNDGILIEIIIPFCDFRSAIMIGMTCKRFKKISDTCLDHAVEVALHNLPEERAEEGEVAFLPISYDGDIDSSENRGVMLQQQKPWTYTTFDMLVEEGINYCNPENSCYFFDKEEKYYDEDTDRHHLRYYDEDIARHDLRTRGTVDVRDFLPQSELIKANRIVWNISINLYKTTPKQAVYKIMQPDNDDAGWYDNWNDDWNDDDNINTEENIIGLCRLRYYTLCLLRKADPTSIRFGSFKAEYRNPDWPAKEFKASVMFSVNNNNNNIVPVEYYVSTKTSMTSY